MADCSGQLLYRASDDALLYRASDGKILYSGCDQPVFTFSGIPTTFVIAGYTFVCITPLVGPYTRPEGVIGCTFDISDVARYAAYVTAGWVYSGVQVWNLYCSLGSGTKTVQVGDNDTWGHNVVFDGSNTGSCSDGITMSNTSPYTVTGSCTLENDNP